MHSQIVDAVAAHDGALASGIWVTDLSYAVRILSDALATLPEVNSVNVGASRRFPNDRHPDSDSTVRFKTRDSRSA
jgi:hypothetical protein